MTFLGLRLSGPNNAAQLGTNYPQPLLLLLCLPAGEGFRQVFEENMHDKRHYPAKSHYSRPLGVGTHFRSIGG
jgi:hypothetical protein